MCFRYTSSFDSSYVFNQALVEGLLHSWSMNTGNPFHKARDPMDLGNYRTNMVVHIVAKLYGSVVDAELNTFIQRGSLC